MVSRLLLLLADEVRHLPFPLPAPLDSELKIPKLRSWSIGRLVGLREHVTMSNNHDTQHLFDDNYDSD